MPGWAAQEGFAIRPGFSAAPLAARRLADFEHKLVPRPVQSFARLPPIGRRFFAGTYSRSIRRCWSDMRPKARRCVAGPVVRCLAAGKTGQRADAFLRHLTLCERTLRS